MTLHLAAPVKSITVGAGNVVSQSPKSGVSQKQGSTITVAVSDGPPNVTVPSLANMTCAAGGGGAAEPALQVGVRAGRLQRRHYGRRARHLDDRLTQNPTEAPYGSTITLVPSLGHVPVSVPSIPATYTFAQAQAALQAVGLSATQANTSSATVAQGNVISTTPASGAPAPYGSAVTVTVSTGPPTTTVPNVIGDTVSQATTAIGDQGLTASGVQGNPNGTVVGTQPSVGSTVDTGSSVELFAH